MNKYYKYTYQILVGIFLLGIVLGRLSKPKTIIEYRNHDEWVLLEADTLKSKLDVMKENGLLPEDVDDMVRSIGSGITKRYITRTYQLNEKIKIVNISN